MVWFSTASFLTLPASLLGEWQMEEALKYVRLSLGKDEKFLIKFYDDFQSRVRQVERSKQESVWVMMSIASHHFTWLWITDIH